MRSLRPIKNRTSAPNPALGPTDATGAPTHPRKAALMHAAHSGTAQDLITQWDRSSRAQRIELLSRFIRRYAESTAAEMEEALGPAATLFFTRLLTWMRLTYQLGYELSVQLSALSLFLQGQRFLSSFAEVGGIEMVTDILCHIKQSVSTTATNASQQARNGLTSSSSSNNNNASGSALIVDRTDDKRNALVLLIHLANSGRVYRELVCDGSGIEHIIDAAMNERDAKTLDFFTSLFLALGQGNPRKASLVHAGLLDLARNGCEEASLCAAGVLRALQLAREQAIVGGGQQMNSTSSASASVLMLTAGSGGGGGPVSQSLANVPVVGVDNASPASINKLLDTLFHLLRSDNVKLRFEGVELLSLVSKSLVLVVPVVERCLQILDQVIPTAPSQEDGGSNGGRGSVSLPPIKKEGGGILSAFTSSPTDALSQAGDVRDLKAKAQLRRLQLSCGRALCTILLDPAAQDDTRMRLYRHFESRGGHMSLVKYLTICDSRNDTAIEEACTALRLLAYFPTLYEGGGGGGYSADAIISRSRTAAFLASVLGKELLMRVLDGSVMTKEQVQMMYKSLRKDMFAGAGAGGGQREGAAQDNKMSALKKRPSGAMGRSDDADSESDYEE